MELYLEYQWRRKAHHSVKRAQKFGFLFCFVFWHITKQKRRLIESSIFFVLCSLIVRVVSTWRASFKKRAMFFWWWGHVVFCYDGTLTFVIGHVVSCDDGRFFFK